MSFRKSKISMEEKLFKINLLLLPNYKNHFKAKKNTKEMDPKWTFKFVDSCYFLVHLTMQLLDTNKVEL